VLTLAVKFFWVATLRTAQLIPNITREVTGFYFVIEEPKKYFKDT
jgi:hypothetical protein